MERATGIEPVLPAWDANPVAHLHQIVPRCQGKVLLEIRLSTAADVLEFTLLLNSESVPNRSQSGELS